MDQKNQIIRFSPIKMLKKTASIASVYFVVFQTYSNASTYTYSCQGLYQAQINGRVITEYEVQCDIKIEEVTNSIILSFKNNKSPQNSCAIGGIRGRNPNNKNKFAQGLWEGMKFTEKGEKEVYGLGMALEQYKVFKNNIKFKFIHVIQQTDGLIWATDLEIEQNKKRLTYSTLAKDEKSVSEGKLTAECK